MTIRTAFPVDQRGRRQSRYFVGARTRGDGGGIGGPLHYLLSLFFLLAFSRFPSLGMRPMLSRWKAQSIFRRNQIFNCWSRDVDFFGAEGVGVLATSVVSSRRKMGKNTGENRTIVIPRSGVFLLCSRLAKMSMPSRLKYCRHVEINDALTSRIRAICYRVQISHFCNAHCSTFLKHFPAYRPQLIRQFSF